MTRRLAAFILIAVGGVAACKKGDGGPTSLFNLSALPSCGSSTQFFTVTPVAPAQIGGWVPLGNLNPPGHTFPTDHQYIYLNTFLTAGSGGPAPVPLLSPGNMTVLGGRMTHYGGGAPDDYSLTFASCRETMGEFGHVRTLAPALLQQIGPFDQQCDTYSPAPGTSVTACYSRSVSVPVRAGDVIGTTSGLDLSFFDNRVTPLVYANASRWVLNSSGFDHFHVVPFSDYFAEPARPTVEGLLGSFDGRVRRTAPPIGGTLATDVPGTAQGVWINPAQPTYPESSHLAIVPDNVDPSRITISMGVSQPGFSSNAYQVTPVSSGLVNRAPAQVTANGSIYCYELQGNWGVVLLQLLDATTLKVEGRNGASRSCATEQPWAFTVNALTYTR